MKLPNLCVFITQASTEQSPTERLESSCFEVNICRGFNERVLGKVFNEFAGNFFGDIYLGHIRECCFNSNSGQPFPAQK